jgi:hypothetical protein
MTDFLLKSIIEYQVNIVILINKQLYMDIKFDQPKEDKEMTAVSDIDNKISGEKLSDLLKKLKFKIKISPEKTIISGYFASDDQTFEQAVNYLAEELGIKGIEHVQIDPESSSIADQLIKMKDDLNNYEGDTVLIAADGFETLSVFDSEDEGLARRGHDYDQNVIQHDPKAFEGLDKKIIILTHIGNSLGEQRYDRAIRSAVQSHFKEFIFEV